MNQPEGMIAFAAGSEGDGRPIDYFSALAARRKEDEYQIFFYVSTKSALVRKFAIDEIPRTLYLFLNTLFFLKKVSEVVITMLPCQKFKSFDNSVHIVSFAKIADIEMRKGEAK